MTIKMHRLMILLMVGACLMVSGTNADADSDYQAIEDAFWEWRMIVNPNYAIDAGRMEFADRNPQVGVDVLDERFKKAEKFMDDILAVDEAQLKSASIKMSYRVLKKALEYYINGYRFKDFTLNYINFLEGPHIGFSHLTKKLPFNNQSDYENYLKRIKGFATLIDQTTDMLKEAVKKGKANHNVSMNRVPGQIKNILDKSYDKTDYYIPLSAKLDGVTVIDATAKADLRTRAKDIIENKIKPAFVNLRTYILNEYVTRPGLGVSTLAADQSPNGTEYYKAALKWHLSSDMSPAKVHQIGLDQVKRIKDNMNGIKDSVGFEGTLKEFIASLKANKSFFLKTEDELLQRYRYIIDVRINSTLHKLFLRPPKLPLEVLNMETDGPGGQYLPGTPDGSVPGVFEANTRDPTRRPTFDMLALCLHEANPGHHMQVSYMLTDKNLPDFRRYSDYTGYYQTPFHFPFYTAYTEGWGLYAEFLGTELGLYNDRYELFGRYVSEMFRACRLVVDTGIHVMGWSRQQAIDYMADHITDPVSQISVEIDRYVTWPGQACAYKIGEIKILEMRKKAEDELGSLFDVKQFHETILTAAALPLDLLENIIQEYINDTKLKGTVSSGNKAYLSISVLLLCYWSRWWMEV
ncbi:uncharacterized protein LOC135501568 isoform X2 [Lineus longissimus]|uniref:uncharacterized protein LOC135501568 isoform X2 n=1 Tax=Lineus longissimus TaxID=88925 RepID=UPI002B4E5BB5